MGARLVKAAAALLASASCQPAAAELPATSASVTLERHATSNALDGPVSLFDWYSLLRGSVETNWTGNSSSLKLGLEAETTLFDAYSFENDHAVALAAVATRKLSTTVEIRGTLSIRHASEGDDLIIGSAILPIRTDTTTVTVAGEAGVDLGDGYALILGVVASRDKAGPTRFAGGLSAELEPDTTRLGASATLKRTVGTFGTAVTASFRATRPDLTGGAVVALTAGEIALRTELRRSLPTGFEIAAAFGAAWLKDAAGLYDEVRPVYELTVKAPLGRAELRGSLFGRYELADTDDPLASFVQRGELTLGYRLTEKLGIGSGMFAELKENLLAGYDERSWGVFGEGGWTVSPKLTLLVRIEYDRTRYTVIGVDERTIDAFVRMRAEL